jgi:hypothetical protein
MDAMKRALVFAAVGEAATGLALLIVPPLVGMLTYGALVTLYLSYLGVQGEWVGPLLWPAVALHAVLTLLLVRSAIARRVS